MPELRGPILAAMSITQKCNLRCTHCYASAGPTASTENELTTAEMLDVMAQMRDMGVLNFDFLGGEPLTRPDLPVLAKWVMEQQIRTNLTTNAVMLTEEWLDRFDKRISLLRIAVDSADPDQHDRFRGMPGAWQKTVHAIRMAVKKGLNVTIVTTFHRGNANQLDDMVNLSLDLGVRAFANTLLLPAGRGMDLQDNVFSPEEARQFCMAWGQKRDELTRQGKRLTLIDETPLTALLASEPGYENEYVRLSGNFGSGAARRACTAGFIQVHLTPTGHLLPCGGMEGIPELRTEANNVRRHSVREIWEKAPLFQAMRDRMYPDRPFSVSVKCKECAYLPYCGGGCRAAAYLKHGDFLHPDPFCWLEAEEGVANGQHAPRL